MSEEYKQYYALVRMILGRYSRYVTDEEIQTAYETNQDAEEFAEHELYELREHFK